MAQLCRDFDHKYTEVNAQLDKMGYNMGVRLIEEFLARTGVRRCALFRETGDMLSKVGFKMFLGVVPALENVAADGRLFLLILAENPLAEFVELPQERPRDLWYSQVLCGVIRGALQMVQMDTDVYFVKDVLRGDDRTEIRVKLNRILKDEVPAGEN